MTFVSTKISPFRRRLFDIKIELYFLRLALFVRKNIVTYCYYRFWIAPKLLTQTTPICSEEGDGKVTICMLISRRDFLLGMWSLKSLYQNTRLRGKLLLFSDGTVTEKQERILKILFPCSKFLSAEKSDKYAQEADIPDFLKNYRSNTSVVFVRRVVDMILHTDTPYVLNIDSDLIWFQHPREISEVTEKSNRDISYMLGVSKQMGKVHFKKDTFVSDSIFFYNAGVSFFHRENFSLKQLSHFLEMVDMEKSQQFVDQAGQAYTLKHLHMLPLDTYVSKGTWDPSVVLRHYTSPQRDTFYTEGLPKIIIKNPL